MNFRKNERGGTGKEPDKNTARLIVSEQLSEMKCVTFNFFLSEI